jgi:hypothetical protein
LQCGDTGSIPVGSTKGIRAEVAQLAEQLTCNEQVGGANPSFSSNPWGGSMLKELEFLLQNFPLGISLIFLFGLFNGALLTMGAICLRWITVSYK